MLINSPFQYDVMWLTFLVIPTNPKNWEFYLLLGKTFKKEKKKLGFPGQEKHSIQYNRLEATFDGKLSFYPHLNLLPQIDIYLNIQIRQNGSCWTCLRTLRILGITRRWWMWYRELSRRRDFLSPPFETLTSVILSTGDSHTWERNIMRDTLMILQAQ